MDEKVLTETKAEAEDNRDISMNSLKRALEDIEELINVEPMKKRVRFQTPKKLRPLSATVRRAELRCRSIKQNLFGNRVTQKVSRRPTAKLLTRLVFSAVPGEEQKTDVATETGTGRKITKRSADALIYYLVTEVSAKKIKIEEVIEEANGTLESGKADEEAIAGNADGTDEAKVADANAKDDESTAVQQGDPQTSGTSQQHVAKEGHAVPGYFSRNVAFSKKVVVYSSDGSEYDYSDDGCDVCIDQDEFESDDSSSTTDDDDGDLYDDYEDPNSEEVSKRLHKEIQDFLKAAGKTRTESDTEDAEENKPETKIYFPVYLMGQPSTSGMCFFPRFNMLPAIKAPPTPEPDSESDDAEEIN